MQQPGLDHAVGLPGCNEECGHTSERCNITSLIWWLIVGIGAFYSPDLIATWLDVRLLHCLGWYCLGGVLTLSQDWAKVIEEYRHLREVWYNEDQADVGTAPPVMAKSLKSER